MTALFYYPMTIHRDGAYSSIEAPTTSGLPLNYNEITDQVVILTKAEPSEQGVYLWDGRNWRMAIPYVDLCNAVISGDSIDLYYDVDQTYTVPTGAIIYRNGIKLPLTEIVPHKGAVYGVRVPQSLSGGGTVTAVNGQLPDSTGNVTLNIDSIPGLQQALGELGKVKSVNSVQPDASGNVQINIADIPQLQDILDSKGEGTVKSVNNTLPDAAGNVDLEIADIPCLQEEIDKKGDTKSVNGNTPNAAGNIDLEIVDIPGLQDELNKKGEVKSVNLKGPDPVTGDVTLNIGDIPNLQQELSNAGKVKTVDGQAPDVNGNIKIKAVDGATGFTSLISDNGETTGNLQFKQLKAGNNIQLDDTNNVITITSTGGGTGNVTAVQSEGTGISLVDKDGTQPGGVATIKSIIGGSNMSITPSPDGTTLTFTANQVIVPATRTRLGGVIVQDGFNIDEQGNLSLAPPIGIAIGGVKAGQNVTIDADGTINATATPYTLPPATTTTLGGIKVGTGLTIQTDGTLNAVGSAAGVTSITVGATALSGALTFQAGQSITMGVSGNTIQFSGTGVPDAPNDGKQYGRQNLQWTVIPDVGEAITSLTSQPGTNAVLLLEAQPDPNTAILKSLVAGTNITLTDNGGLITVDAAIPAGTVATVNHVVPDGAGNVQLKPNDIGAVDKTGDSMSGPLDMGLNKITGLFSPTDDRDAVNLGFIKGLIINGGVIG